MKLNVGFTELNLAAAKMKGLDAYLLAIREAKKGFVEGLDLAKQYVMDNGGTIADEDNEGITVLTLFDEKAYCFQLYDDVDLFYFET